MKYAIVSLFFFALVSNTQAGIIVGDIADTVGLPGFKTITLAVLAEGDESVRGFDATFTGPLNQVNPFGIATIFQDSNAIITGTGSHVSQDSQFLFQSTDVLSIDAAESNNSLSGAISGLAALETALPNPAPFVQLVVSDTTAPFFGADVQADLAIDLGTPEPLMFTGNLAFIQLRPVPFFPEPSSLTMVCLGLAGFSASRRRSS